MNASNAFQYRTYTMFDSAYPGFAIYCTRVDRWECDFNDHWKTCNYARSFQMATETCVGVAGQTMPDCDSRSRHIRYLRELRDGDLVELRSAVIGDGPFAGCVVHWLCTDGKLSATALDHTIIPDEVLPVIGADVAYLALPRGLDPLQTDLSAQIAPTAFQVPLGVARPADFDYRGWFLDDCILRQVAIVSSQYLATVGFTPDFTAKTGFSRMSVEMRYTRKTRCRAGDLFWADATVLSLDRKSLVLHHDIFAGSARFARVEHVLVVVDLKTRRIVAVPRDQLAFGDWNPEAG